MLLTHSRGGRGRTRLFSAPQRRKNLLWSPLGEPGRTMFHDAAPSQRSLHGRLFRAARTPQRFRDPGAVDTRNSRTEVLTIADATAPHSTPHAYSSRRLSSSVRPGSPPHAGCLPRSQKALVTVLGPRFAAARMQVCAQPTDGPRPSVRPTTASYVLSQPVSSCRAH